jgi:uncharacterized metal-binding protein
MAEESCACKAAPTLLFACSGAADVGLLSDRAVREMTRQGAGKMFCLAGVGGRVSGIMQSTAAATKILAVDGCKLHCTKHCLEQAGFTDFTHLGIESMGYEKGKSPVTDEAVARVAKAGTDLMNQGECCK